MENSKRLVWIDIIKVIAAFLIVLQHSLAMEWVDGLAPGDTRWRIINLLFIIVKTGLPLFFMCSGATMLRRKHSIQEIFTSSIPRVIIPYVAWMVVYGIVDAIGASSPRVAVNAVIKSVIFGHYHTWFIATLLGLYLITPFIQVFVQEKNLVLYFLILSVIFTVLLPYTQLLGDDRLTTVISDFNMHFVVGYVIYYLAGYYIVNYAKAFKWYLCAGVYVICLAITQLLSAVKVGTIGQEVQNYYSTFSIMGFVLTISLFMTIMSLTGDMQGEKLLKVTGIIGSIGIGIYLLHPMLLPVISGFHGYYRIPGALIIYVIAAGINLILRLTPLRKLFL